MAIAWFILMLSLLFASVQMHAGTSTASMLALILIAARAVCHFWEMRPKG
jgi:hypothetical protein